MSKKSVEFLGNFCHPSVTISRLRKSADFAVDLATLGNWASITTMPHLHHQFSVIVVFLGRTRGQKEDKS